MTIQRLLIAPPYLQFFISDPSADDVPIQGEKIQIISNGRVISVPCRYWDEGDTELIVGSSRDFNMTEKAQFHGKIATPSRTVLFSDAEATELLRLAVPGLETHVQIWTDGSILPEKITVGIG